MRRGVRSAPGLFVTVLLTASSALAQRTVEAQSPVVQMLRRSPDARTRAQAAITLARFPSPDAHGHPDAHRYADSVAQPDAVPDADVLHGHRHPRHRNHPL